jgi:hypothetical protein
MACSQRDVCNFAKNHPEIVCDRSSQDPNECIIVRQTRKTNIHHKIPKSQSCDGRKHDPIEVDAIRHRLFHELFRTWDARRIADDLTKFWIDSNLSLLVVPKKHLEKMRAYLKELNHDS